MKWKGTPQPFAITKYIECVQHFSSLTTGNKTSLSPQQQQQPPTPKTNFSYIHDNDDSDIVYTDDEGEIDTTDDESCHDRDDDREYGSQNISVRQQSTLMNHNHLCSSIDNNATGGIGSDGDGDTPPVEEDMSILQAAMYGRPARLRTCIRKCRDGGEGAEYDVDGGDETGQTPLHMAADEGYVECVSLLIGAGANVNAKDEAGISALGVAVCRENVEVVKMLLEAGANPDQEDEDGDTPRSCVKDVDSVEIKELFGGMIQSG